jgi:hypothetical protein
LECPALVFLSGFGDQFFATQKSRPKNIKEEISRENFFGFKTPFVYNVEKN